MPVAHMPNILWSKNRVIMTFLIILLPFHVTLFFFVYKTFLNTESWRVKWLASVMWRSLKNQTRYFHIKCSFFSFHRKSFEFVLISLAHTSIEPCDQHTKPWLFLYIVYTRLFFLIWKFASALFLWRNVLSSVVKTIS